MRPNCFTLAYDNDWQYPVITEQAAFKGIKQIFKTIYWDPFSSDTDEDFTDCIVYLAYPWATLIDSIRKGTEKGNFLYRTLKSMGEKLSEAARVITTCQHIHAYDHPKLFKDAHVSDIFWSHEPSEQAEDARRIDFANTLPFQLYPAQASALTKNKEALDLRKRRRYLYSFSGAASNQYYISRAREWIGSRLTHQPSSYIKIKDSWHYQGIVYDEQINMSTSKHRSTEDHQYLELLESSDFSLCPAGTGPNTIRLWESINTLSVPVLIGNYYFPPAPLTANWTDAVIYVDDNEKSISEIPDLLRGYSDSQIAEMRQSLMLLAREFSEPFFSDKIATAILSLSYQK